MSPIVRKVTGALLAAFAMSVGTTLGEIARDAIKERFHPKPEPEKQDRRRRSKR